MYQHQFYVALCRRHQVHAYGPGYPGYDRSHTIDDVLEQCPFTPDLICFGAAWEYDVHPTEFELHPAINVSQAGVPTVMILNKEYKKLDHKFAFIAGNNVRLVFTAHHNYRDWQRQTDCSRNDSW